MSGNTTSLYSTSSSNGTTGSNNFTTLYPSTQGVIIPTTPYGNANVVALLAAGTDGGNTVANVIAAGTVTANTVSTPIVYSQGLAVQGYDFVQMQYSNSVALPVSPYDIGTGSLFYLDSGGATFQSNTTGQLQTVVQGNDGSVSATGNITAPYFFGNGSQLTGLPATYSNANVTSLLANFGSNVISTTGNITSGNSKTSGTVSATGNITTQGYFIGTFLGNIVGNLIVPGANTQVLYNNNGNADASAGFTFNSASNAVVVTGNISAANVSTTGNVTGTYILGNGSQLTGIVTSTYGNAQVASFLASFGSNSVSTTGNITAGLFVGNGSGLSNITGANVTGTVATATLALTANTATTAGTVTSNAQPNITSVGSLTSVSVTGNTISGNILTGGQVSATGNITGNYLLGNGAFISGLPAGYSNADVATFLANFGSNSISTTGNITAGYVIGNGSALTNITGANVTGTVANATYAISAGSADTANLAQYVTANAQANITSVGVLTSLSVSGNTTTGNMLTPGVVSATGNITGNYFIGNGSQLTGIFSTYGNANVATFLANFGSNSISTTGNITASLFLGNGSQLSNITGANVTGTVANAASAVTANAATYAGTVTANAQPNITSVGILTAVSVSGNTTTGNMLTSGIVSATGNVTGNYFIGNGSQLTGIVASSNAAGANTQIQYNNANAFAGNAAMVFDNTTGNVTLSTLIIGNTTAGNANGATRVNTTATFVGQPNSAAGAIAGQILIGNGYFGSFNNANTPAGASKGAKVVIWDSVTLAAANRYSSLQTMAQIVVANSSNQAIRSVVSHLQFGGGANANISSTNAGGAIGVNQVVFVGGGSGQPLIGNTVAAGTTAALGSITVANGSNLQTGVGVGVTINSQNSSGAYAAGILGNTVGFIPAFNLNSIASACYGYYFPDQNNTWGYNSNGNARSSPSYYSIFNADAVAQNQLGSLRAYHTFQASGTTTGTWNIDKSAGQVQAISTTGNVTIGSYTNFVTTASNSVSNLSQSDTVTLIIEQGATPYTVTMPTGNSAIRYANGVSTVTATANSTTMIAITAFRTAANATSYLTTISPAFS